jgi:hypothetical protein
VTRFASIEAEDELVEIPLEMLYWLRVFGFSGLEELIGKVASGERGVTTAILK